MSDYEEKFGSLARVYGEDALALMGQSHICVVGIGGVGSWVIEALARSGVGQLTLVDGDTISASNSNRQIHSLDSTLGQSKVEVMRARVLDINPDCIVHAISSNIDDSNIRDIIERQHEGKYYDAVVDAIDSIQYKATLIYCCRRNKIPIVTTGGAGGLTNPTMIEIKDLCKTWNDPDRKSVV